MTKCYLLPMLPEPTTLMKTGGFLQGCGIRLHRLHRLQMGRDMRAHRFTHKETT